MPDFSAPSNVPLKFDQGSKWPFPLAYYDSLNKYVNLAGYGARLLFLTSDSATVLLTLSTANGKIVIDNSRAGQTIGATLLANITATILASDSGRVSPMNGVLTGVWDLYLDPTGIEDGSTYKLVGGSWSMKPLGGS